MNYFLEVMETALPITGLGMGIVFLILMILWGVLELFRIVFYEMPLKKEAALKAAALKEAPTSPQENQMPAQQEAEDENELIAVFAAAISSMMGTSANNLMIKSFRKIENNAPVWNRVSRREQLDRML
jgi:sodium pump decarboxylase gamma subunit